MENKEKDRWDKANIILGPVGGALTALAIGLLGFLGSRYLAGWQDAEMNVRLYSELMSKREETESALRKEMFQSILQSFLKPESAHLETEVLKLELLAYNFHESINLKPLFIHLRKEIIASKDAAKKDYLDRLNRVARDVMRRQLLVVEGSGAKLDLAVDFKQLRRNPASIFREQSLSVGGIERRFRILVQDADPKKEELKVVLEVRTPNHPDEEAAYKVMAFHVGSFDFPMIDNTRLSHDQRYAVVLNQFNESTADITLVYFPGSHASLKEKPYYEEVVQSLLKTRPDHLHEDKIR